MQVERAHQIDGNQLAPFLRRRFKEWLEDVPASIVDQHVNRTEHVSNRLDCRVYGGVVRDVAHKGGSNTAFCLDRCDDSICASLRDVKYGDLSAFCCEASTDRTANPATTACYDYNLVS